MTQEQTASPRIPQAPAGWRRIWWIGPGIIWMISAIATGELLFTPRIGSLYGYSVLWAMVVALFLKVALAREIGRYAVVTGGSLLHGIRALPGPMAWGVWFLVAPQFVVAVTTITGMAGATGSAVALVAPGGFQFWAVVFIVLSVSLVLWGKYKGVEWTSIMFSIVITVALVIAAGIVFPGVQPLAAGLAPQLPANVDYSEVLPWLGFMMSGAAGLVWYSYWLSARGYGAAHDRKSEDAEPINPHDLNEQDKEKLRKWISTTTGTTLAAASIVVVLLVALLILGTQLLRPEGLLPEGPAVTAVLSRLLGDVWGGWGTWLMIIASFFAFWSTIIANLDGWGRMLSQASVWLARRSGLNGMTTSLSFYRWIYVAGLMGVLPAVLASFFAEPMEFLIIAGIIEAIQIPFLALAVLYLNARTLPSGLKPSWIMIGVLALTSLFFLAFAVLYLYFELF